MINAFLFSLGKVDTIFLFVIIGVILVGVGIYFLIPILNRKQYQQMRENLAKREAAFKSTAHIQERTEKKEQFSEED